MKAQPRKPGGTKRTPERIAKLAELLSQGHSMTAAAESIRICRQTVYRWMAESSDIRDMLSRARAEFAAVCEAQIAKAIKDGDWRAGAWWLERQFPEEYGRKAVSTPSESEMTWEKALARLEETQAKRGDAGDGEAT